MVLIPAESVFPLRGSVESQFRLGKKVVLPSTLVGVGSYILNVADFVEALDAAARVGVSQAEAKGCSGSKLGTDVCPLCRIGIIVVDPLALGVELLGEQI